MYISPYGAIFADKGNLSLVIFETLFSSSYSMDEGGSIYFFVHSCIQNRVCSVNSTNFGKYPNGCHSFIEATIKNYIIESSITKARGYVNSAFLQYGDQIIESTNISHAKCEANAAFSTTESNSFRMNFTSIYNNSAIFRIAVIDARQGYIDHCNIVNNVYTTDSDLYTLISCTSGRPVEFNLCVFALNTGKYMFDIDYGKLVVDQCYFVNNHVTPPTSTESMKINTTQKFVLSLHHLSTQECVDFPLMNIIFQRKDKTTNPYYMDTSIISLSFYDSFYE